MRALRRPDRVVETVIPAIIGTSGNPASGLSTASLWADSTLPWRPIMCHNTYNKNVNPGYSPCNMFQVQPVAFQTCDPTRGQSAHIGGMNVGLGDGIHFSSPGLGRIDLEPVSSTEAGAVTILRFRVPK